MKNLCRIMIGILAIASLHADEQKPNIVLLYIDDWAWNGTPVAMDPDLENSRMPVVEMPNLERLAREGMIFSNAYGSPQCSPGRACVLTGQSSARNGLTVYMNARGQEYYNESEEYEGFPVVPCIANETIDPETTLAIPKALAPYGYASAHLGKWHMRGDPGAHGYLLHDGDTDNNPGNTVKTNLKEGEEKPRRLTEELMTDPKLMFSITDKAIGFMEEQVEKGNPFYVQISHYAMHAGSECKVETREKYVSHPAVQQWYEQNDKTVDSVNMKEDPAVWLGMADDLDGRIGAVLDRLDELGVADNTYVIMVADNGYRHEFLPDLTQPLHARKWWVWDGGIRVPMIVRGPDIEGGSLFRGNVVNYDFLPTFVDWAGGDPSELEEVDGVSLAPYMAGEEPDEAFLKRNLHFHYPHYRSTMPHTAMISGNEKIMHFWGHEDTPMLFDLADDPGEVRNLAAEKPARHEELKGQLVAHLEEADGRIPKVNPDYDPEKDRAHQDYWYRVNWGPFKGERPLDDDEREPQVVLMDVPRETNVKPLEIQFSNLEDQAKVPAGTDLEVKVTVQGGQDLSEVKLYLDGLLLNAQGMTIKPTAWTGSGDYLLKEMTAGSYSLKAVAEDVVSEMAEARVQIQVGQSSSSPIEGVYRVILEEGERLKSEQAIKLPRLEALLKLEGGGQLLFRSDVEGKLFRTDNEPTDGPHYAILRNGQLRVHHEETNEVLWETPKLKGEGTVRLGVTVGKELVIFDELESGVQKVLWKSH